MGPRAVAILIYDGVQILDAAGPIEVFAMANRLAWGWCIGAILGIAIAFGAPQIVSWVRGMFGV